MIIYGGSENKDVIAELTQKYGVKRVVVSTYHPQVRKMIEHGHKPIIDTFSKMLNGGPTNWVRNLPTFLWADRSTLHISTGFTPYYIYYDNKPVFSIELDVPTW